MRVNSLSNFLKCNLFALAVISTQASEHPEYSFSDDERDESSLHPQVVRMDGGEQKIKKDEAEINSERQHFAPAVNVIVLGMRDRDGQLEQIAPVDPLVTPDVGVIVWDTSEQYSTPVDQLLARALHIGLNTTKQALPSNHVIESGMRARDGQLLEPEEQIAPVDPLVTPGVYKLVSGTGERYFFSFDPLVVSPTLVSWAPQEEHIAPVFPQYDPNRLVPSPYPSWFFDTTTTPSK